MEKINKKYEELVKEIKWRFKESDYKESDKSQVVIHETIDKDVSFISIADVESLCDELGYSKMSEVEQSYIDEFGEMPKYDEEDIKSLKKQRLILYWYFEQRVYNDDKMRLVLKVDN